MIYIALHRGRLDEENRLAQQNQWEAQNLEGPGVEVRPQMEQIGTELKTI